MFISTVCIIYYAMLIHVRKWITLLRCFSSHFPLRLHYDTESCNYEAEFEVSFTKLNQLFEVTFLILAANLKLYVRKHD